MPKVMHCNFLCHVVFCTHTHTTAAKKCSPGIFLFVSSQFPHSFPPLFLAAPNCCIFCGTCVAVIWFTCPRLDRRRQENCGKGDDEKMLALCKFHLSFSSTFFSSCVPVLPLLSQSESNDLLGFSSNCVNLCCDIPSGYCFYFSSNTNFCLQFRSLCILWFFIVSVTDTHTHSHPLIEGPSVASCVILSALCQKLFCNICYYALDNNFITFSPSHRLPLHHSPLAQLIQLVFCVSQFIVLHILLLCTEKCIFHDITTTRLALAARIGLPAAHFPFSISQTPHSTLHAASTYTNIYHIAFSRRWAKFWVEKWLLAWDRDAGHWQVFPLHEMRINCLRQ